MHRVTNLPQSLHKTTNHHTGIIKTCELVSHEGGKAGGGLTLLLYSRGDPVLCPPLHYRVLNGLITHRNKLSRWLELGPGLGWRGPLPHTLSRRLSRRRLPRATCICTLRHDALVRERTGNPRLQTPPWTSKGLRARPFPWGRGRRAGERHLCRVMRDAGIN